MSFGDMLLLNRISSLTMRLDPIRDAASGDVVGRETRWEIFDDGRVVDVNDLLRDTYTREEYGLVDRWAVRSALDAAETADRADPVRLHVDVRSIAHPDHARNFYQWLRDLGGRLRDIALEIDECFVHRYRDTFGGFARAVRRVGVEIVIDHALDREGTEEVLRAVQCDAIKIDASLIGRLATDPQSRETAARIVRLAHSTGMYAVAMGVSDQETWERARDLGCDRVQGSVLR
jgi:EAL domain-containing protein (putative c-di-GMP-specific phosphodiesterase class I)